MNCKNLNNAKALMGITHKVELLMFNVHKNFVTLAMEGII